jgi:hypothetical protein
LVRDTSSSFAGWRHRRLGCIFVFVAKSFIILFTKEWLHFSPRSLGLRQEKIPGFPNVSMTIEFRPHHLLDILCDYGYGIRYQPHEYGHALHLIADEILSNPDSEILLVIAADSICRPCRHLHSDGQCDDVLDQTAGTPSKQAHNDGLDQRLWSYLELDTGNRMTVRDFLMQVQRHLAGIEKICTHPGENERY